MTLLKLGSAMMAGLALALFAAGQATAQGDGRAAFTTLGTGAGPTPQEKRAQPANLLRAGGQTILVDAGDGATQQLGKIDLPIERVGAVFISHLHFDHTGGLFGFLSRRFQLLAPGQVTIYGPPGTKATVDAMIAAMAPAVTAASNIRARSGVAPRDTVRVVELRDGWIGQVGGIKVTAVSNSHYVLQAAAAGSTKSDTYAFRFDTPRRSLVYTGDTGPSTAVEALAKGADVLFSEIMDPDTSLAELKARRPDVAPTALAAVEAHYRKQHLSPKEVGLMAERAGVKALVLTHNAIPDGDLATARTIIAAQYKGPITFAEDLQTF